MRPEREKANYVNSRQLEACLRFYKYVLVWIWINISSLIETRRFVVASRHSIQLEDVAPFEFNYSMLMP